MESTNTYIKTADACRILGIVPNTLRAWEARGKVKAIRTDGGQRRYCAQSVYGLLHKPSLVIGYILDRPTDTEEGRKERQRMVTELSPSVGGQMLVVKDVGSPYDLNRPGLMDIIERSRNYRIVVYIANCADLAVIGYQFIVDLIERNDGRVMVLDRNPSQETEMVEAMLTTTLLVPQMQ